MMVSMILSIFLLFGLQLVLDELNCWLLLFGGMDHTTLLENGGRNLQYFEEDKNN